MICIGGRKLAMSVNPKTKFIKQMYSVSLAGANDRAIKFDESGSRKYVEYLNFYSAVIMSARRKDLGKKLKGKSLKLYKELKEVWFRNPTITEVGINVVKESRNNAAPSLENCWCLTWKCKLLSKRFIYFFVNESLYCDVQYCH